MSSMRVGLLVVLSALAVLSGCAYKSASSGEPAVARSGQAELIGEFVNARYDRLERSLAQFEHYVGLVLTQAEIPEAVFLDGRSILLIVDGGPQRLMAEFAASPGARPLSDADHAHFRRIVGVREEQAGLLYDAVFERIQASGSGRLVSELNLLSWFIGGLEMRTFLEEIPDELLQECAGQIRAAMLDFDRPELWQALLSRHGAPLQRYRESGPLPTLEYLTIQQIQPVVQGYLHGPLEHVGRGLVANALGQAFAMDLYGMEHAALKFSGFNALMGEELATRLHARAMQAVQDVERTATDDHG
jgi:hypothetical protein